MLEVTEPGPDALDAERRRDLLGSLFAPADVAVLEYGELFLYIAPGHPGERELQALGALWQPAAECWRLTGNLVSGLAWCARYGVEVC